MMTNIAGFLIRSLVNTLSAASLRVVLPLSHPLKDEQQWKKRERHTAESPLAHMFNRERMIE